MTVLLWILIICFGLPSMSTQDCQATQTKPYIYHASKTPYELINNEDSSPIFVAGCKPVMFWLTARHGTRYPPAADVIRMKDRLPKLRKNIIQNQKERRGTLCQQDVDALTNNGSLRIDDNFDQALTQTGREELLLLARRFRGRFADFFQKPYTSQDYQFRHIENPSSQASARAFSRGLFKDVDVRLTQAPPGDRLLQFYDNCTLWNEHVDQNDESNYEFRLFRQSATFQRTMADVTHRLGFQYNMTSEDVLLIYDICRYQKAWNLEQISPWCAAFSSENLKVLEYAEDLQTYYKKGYGYKLNYQQACPLVEDFITRIRHFKENVTSHHQRGVFYFTEEDGILRFLARLGLAKDERPLTHEYLSVESADRKWRTSLMGSFASNIAFVLYNCTDDFKIQVFVKEDVVHLDQCQNALCTYNEFLSVFGPLADKCTSDDGCNPNSASLPSAILTLVIIPIIIFISNAH